MGFGGWRLGLGGWGGMAFWAWSWAGRLASQVPTESETTEVPKAQARPQVFYRILLSKPKATSDVGPGTRWDPMQSDPATDLVYSHCSTWSLRGTASSTTASAMGTTTHLSIGYFKLHTLYLHKMPTRTTWIAVFSCGAEYANTLLLSCCLRGRSSIPQLWTVRGSTTLQKIQTAQAPWRRLHRRAYVKLCNNYTQQARGYPSSLAVSLPS